MQYRFDHPRLASLELADSHRRRVTREAPQSWSCSWETQKLSRWSGAVQMVYKTPPILYVLNISIVINYWIFLTASERIKAKYISLSPN